MAAVARTAFVRLCLVMDDTDFGALLGAVEAPLRRTLVAWYGPTLGRDATQAALAWAWEHRNRLDGMHNPAGYLFRVGQSHAKRELRRSRTDATGMPSSTTTTSDGDSPFEPELTTAIAELSPQQRAAVLLVHGYGYSFREAADVLGVSLGSLRTHVDRGLTRLRSRLEVSDESPAS
jgi:RNA polymerase sigma factor (sigma-70 family)